MSSTSAPTITLVPPPRLAPQKLPPDFDMTLFPTIISTVIFGAIFFATVWLYNSKKEVLLPDEYDLEIYSDMGPEDVEMHGGISPQLQPGPEYVDSVVVPNRTFATQASKQPADWSHAIGTDNSGKQLHGSAEHSGPSSGFIYTPHSSPQTGGTSGDPYAAKQPRPLASPTRPPPAMAAYSGQQKSPATLKPAAWPAPGASGAREVTGGNSVFTGMTASEEPSQLPLGPEYVGSEVTGLEQGGPLSEDYTAVLKRR